MLFTLSASLGTTAPANAQHVAVLGLSDCGRQMVYTHDSVPESVYFTNIAVCGSGFEAGTAGFNAFWTEMAKVCAAGNPPTKLWANFAASPLLRSSSYNRPECKRIAQLITDLKIPVGNIDMLESGENAKLKRKEAQQILRRNALKGSVEAKFMLAYQLLDIENFSPLYQPREDEAFTLYYELARDGYSDKVFSLLIELHRKYPEPRQENIRYSTFMFMYGALAKANDPRGYIALSGHYLQMANANAKSGKWEAADGDIYSAKKYAASARQYARPQEIRSVDDLDKAIQSFEQSKISIADVLLVVVAASVLLGSRDGPVQETPVAKTDRCEWEKVAIILDPSLEVPYALVGGCAR